MKTNPRTNAAVALLLLGVCVLACKSTKSSNNSSQTTQSASSNSGDTTRSSNHAAPATQANIAGRYSIVGTNPTGTIYRGALQIIEHGDVYQFRWNAGNQYDGVGVVNGEVVAVAFANGQNGTGCGVVEYKIQNDGSLTGRWGYWGKDEAGSEDATRTSGSDLAGEYDATGKNPNGSNYKVKLTVEPAGNLYRFVWSNNTDGVGIRDGDNVAVGIGGARCGFVAYEIKADGTLEGVWGGYGSDQTGTEKATKQ